MEFKVKDLSLFLLALLLSPILTFSQEIANVEAEIQGTEVRITYDLVKVREGQTFQILLFTSANKFLTPMEKVTGDVGNDVKPGENKSIFWNAADELVRFRGEINFEVRALVFTPYVDFIFPAKAGDALKRGKTNVIEWSGGNTTDQLQLELYRNGSKIQTIETTANTGSFTWVLSETIKPGGEYQVRISKEDQPSNFALSRTFAIKRKIPLGLKTIPVLAIAGIVGVLAGGGGGSSGGDNSGDDRLVDPPDLE